MDIVLPGYTTGFNSYESIYKIVSPFGKKVTIIGGETALNVTMPILQEHLSNFDILDVLIYGKEVTISNVEKLLENESVCDCDVIFAVGGGKAIDTAKYVASELNKTIFTFPTLASNCASVSKEVYVYNEDGSLNSKYVMNNNIKHVFINESIILQAPFMYFHAGVGFALTKAYEPIFKARRVQTTFEDDLALNMCISLKDELFLNANKALKYFSNNDETIKIISNIIITTGYITNLLNKDLNKGIPHSVYQAMSNIYGFKKLNLLGDALTYGLLINLIYEKSNEMYRVHDFLKDNGFPVKLIELKLKFDNMAQISGDTIKQESMQDYPKSVSSHDISRGIILLEEEFLLQMF